jgi:hypothetical protein
MFQYCSTKLLSTPVELGGPGVIVQIDARYVRRFGHLWLAQCHPKPSLVDVVGLVAISIELWHVGQLHTSPGVDQV